MRSLATRALVAAALSVTPLSAYGQPSTIPRIGWISLAGPEDADTSPFFEAFRAELHDLGYVEGHNLTLEARWARGDPAQGAELAKDLVRLGVAAIVTQGAAIRVVRPVAGSVPIVFAMSADPEKAGLVESLARPGRNFTGATFMSYEVNAKRLELLKEAFPALSKIALLSNPEHPGEDIELEVSRKAAASLGLTIDYVPIRSADELDRAFAAIANAGAEAIVALPDALVMQHRARLIEFATRLRIPAVSGWPAFARSGGLMTYGPNLRQSFRVVARSVDKVLKGAHPAELPVEQPTTFELVINLKAAKALGIEVPPPLLTRADEVIE
jgi:putative tryptophan/tyrosine transport system substrate-binding protein